MSTAEEVSRIMALVRAFEVGSTSQEYRALESAITALAERAEADRVDAERYRRLQSVQCDNCGREVWFQVGRARCQITQFEIDAARQGNSHD